MAIVFTNSWLLQQRAFINSFLPKIIDISRRISDSKLNLVCSKDQFFYFYLTDFVIVGKDEEGKKNGNIYEMSVFVILSILCLNDFFFFKFNSVRLG